MMSSPTNSVFVGGQVSARPARASSHKDPDVRWYGADPRAHRNLRKTRAHRCEGLYSMVDGDLARSGLRAPRTEGEVWRLVDDRCAHAHALGPSRDKRTWQREHFGSDRSGLFATHTIQVFSGRRIGGIATVEMNLNHYLGNRTISRRFMRAQNACGTVASDPAFAQEPLKPNRARRGVWLPGKTGLGPEVPTPKTQQQKGKSTGGEAVQRGSAGREKRAARRDLHQNQLPGDRRFQTREWL